MHGRSTEQKELTPASVLEGLKKQSNWQDQKVHNKQIAFGDCLGAASRLYVRAGKSFVPVAVSAGTVNANLMDLRDAGLRA